MVNLCFGDYCKIEQKRYGVENEIYRYKVIGSSKANYFRPVPVDSCAPHNKIIKGRDWVDVVKVIKCGVDETKVETFRRSDVQSIN